MSNTPVVTEVVRAELRSVLSFDGSKGHVEVADPFDDDTAFTVALWVKTNVLDDGARHGLIGREGDPHRKPMLWQSSANGALCYAATSAAGEPFEGAIDGFFEKDRWTHVAWVKRGTVFEFYRDGQRVAERPAPSRIYVRRSSYWIGRSNGYWSGHVAHVRVYQAAKSAADVRADMRRALDLEAPTLVSAWAFDEGEGTTACDKAVRAAHGALLGATWDRSTIPFLALSNAADASELPQWQTIEGAYTSVVTGKHADGRIAIAARGADGAMFLVSQTAPDTAEWGSPQNLAGGIKGRPALAANKDGRLYCAAIGMDDELCSRQQASANSVDWANYQHRKGCPVVEIAQATNADGRIAVVARGTDNQLWYTAQTAADGDAWSAWAACGGALGAAPAAVRTKKGRLEVFARGAGGDLWHAWQDTPGAATFRPWHPLGGDVVGAPAVGQTASGALRVFVRGPDKAVWTIAQDETTGVWGEWASLGQGGGGAASSPVCVTDAEGRFVALVRDEAGGLWCVRQSAVGGAFGAWVFLGGAIGSFGVARYANGKLGVFAVGPEGKLVHIREGAAGKWV